MGRTRKSARDAGARCERDFCRAWTEGTGQEVERRVRNGVRDRGDVAGATFAGQRLVVECKNARGLNLSGWIREAEAERLNDGAGLGVVYHHRHGYGDPLDSYVTMTLRTLIEMRNHAER